ncbi:hypothetical protein DID80_07915 [Candidatus Marinamargulisbacteria bacterium SCGC AAA071-K20]|nr:hypothetical protein DID80_07915 [Candidatus Marinamargulisbacteria bacterium SCGC AAA071-K20]
MPKTNTRERIFSYIQENHRVSPKELVEEIKISSQALFKQIKKLLNEKKIEKIGSSPKVFYQISQDQLELNKEDIEDNKVLQFIKTNFYTVTPLGVEKKGVDGFRYWCKKRNCPINKTANEYMSTCERYNLYKDGVHINGTAKMKKTFKNVWMDDLFYLDFYAIERFGKTKLGYMLLYAKQSQTHTYINSLIQYISDPIKEIIKKYNVDGIAFAPPTVKREVQLMKELEKKVSFGLKVVSIEKVKTPIIVPQKTLSKLDDRIENARNTMVVTENNEFNTILLIDDAVGSGATLNEISAQIKRKKICKKLICLAITGSFKGFDVISEV